MEQCIHAYSMDNFAICTGAVKYVAVPCGNEFEEKLLKQWTKAEDTGLLRYIPSKEPQSRILGERYSLYLQLNIERAVKRRMPAVWTGTVLQPTDPSGFTFMAVKKKETLIKMVRAKTLIMKNDSSLSEGDENLLLLNVSPICHGHFIILPNAAVCRPQVLDRNAVRLGIELVLLSSTWSFRVGFNSAFALASVNQQHLHGWYLPCKSFVETIAGTELLASFYELKDAPLPGFCFLLETVADIEKISKNVSLAVEAMSAWNIAHNVFMTRGYSFKQPAKPAVRIVVWPRKRVYGVKDQNEVNIACAELGGHLVIKKAEFFDELTELRALELFSNAHLDSSEFEKLKKHLIEILAGKVFSPTMPNNV